MKKILHFHPNWFYAKIFIYPLNNLERQIGFESTLVTAVNTPKNSVHLDFLIFKKTYKLPWTILKLIKLIYIKRPEIVICHNTTAAILPLIIAKILFVKKVIYFNHGLPFVGYNGILKHLLYFAEKVNCIFSTEVITVSAQTLEILKKITSKKVSIIYNGSACGINLTKHKKTNNCFIDKIKNEINFSSKDVIVLYVGRPNKRKGFHDLMKIWEEYFITHKKFKLLLLGINNLDVKKVINRIPENIFPLSFVTNIHHYQNLTDYLFMTSHHEGLNYTVLESFKYGSIVLSNKIPGISELITHRKNGFLIEKNSGKSFFKTVMECEKNINLKTKIIKNGKKTVNKYDRNKFLSYYKTTLEDSNLNY